MFRLEWTAHEPKPRAEIDDLYGELLESVALDGPYEFSTLVCAARLLETRYVSARIVGYADREPTLDYSDVVEFFMCLDDVVDALTSHRAGVIEFYPGPGNEFVVFDATTDPVPLFRVPWLETSGRTMSDPLPSRITARPSTTRGRDDLAAHFRALRREFARAAIAQDPRLAAHEPLRRWSLN
jgi:hypothetical protein